MYASRATLYKLSQILHAPKQAARQAPSTQSKATKTEQDSSNAGALPARQAAAATGLANP